MPRRAETALKGSRAWPAAERLAWRSAPGGGQLTWWCALC